MRDTCQQIAEINTVAAMLRRNGYGFADHGTSVLVADPVHRSIGGMLELVGTTPVVIRTVTEARRFIDIRS